MSNVNPNPFTPRPEIEGTFGVVPSTHWIATAVGMSVLEKGGNAFDAACATAFTLQVVEPHLNGPGGDVPAVLFDVRKGHAEVICGQGPAPAGATIAHYRSLGLDMMPGTGLLAACVPGMFDAWMMLLRDYGTMRLADVLAPAIFYAGEGHPLVERANATISTVEKLFREHWPTSAAVYLRDGEVPATGTLFTNPAIADTYARVLLKGFALDGLDVTGPEFIHTVVEASKLAFADREKFYGDPEFEQVPIETLLSDAYNEERRKLIRHTASLELQPGSVEGFGAVVKLKPPTHAGEGRDGAGVAAAGAGEPTVGRLGEMRGDTVPFDIVDRGGNM